MMNFEICELDPSLLLNLKQLWNDCGYPEEILKKKRKAVKTHFEVLLGQMIQEETNNRKNLLNTIEKEFEEISAIQQDLHIRQQFDYPETMPLYELDKLLSEQLKSYKKIRDYRLSEFEKLKERELVLGKLLKKDLKSTAYGSVPSESQLHELESFLKDCDLELEKLRSDFNTTKCLAQNLIDELHIRPMTNMELFVTNNGVDIKISKENFEELQQLLVKLKQHKENNKSEVNRLREKLSNLWHRLKEDIRLRDEFLQTYRGHSDVTITVLKEEIKRCEKKKMENIKEFVNQLREELGCLWDLCRFGSEQRKQFIAFSSDCFTEDLLDLHELEVSKMKNYYEENIQLFYLIEDQSNLWKKLMELENNENDPNRYTNRGCGLLQEERERKRIQKKLPKIEEAIVNYVDDYERKSNTKFLIDDVPIKELIQKEYNDLQEKRDKKRTKKIKNPTPSTSVIKRKLPTVPSTSSRTKKPRVEKQQSYALRSAGKVRRKIQNISKSGTDTLLPLPAGLSSNVTSYSSFQTHLENRSLQTQC